MQVSIVRSGGLAGVPMRWTLDGAALPSQERDALRGLVRSALASPPVAAEGGSGRPVPDAFSYEATVQDEGEARTVSFGHGDMTPQWRDVLSWVQQHPAHRQELVDPLT